MSREFFLSEVRFGRAHFTMESFVNPGGEDDPILAACMLGKFDENESLSYWAYFSHLAKSGELLLDVGAYAGLYSLVAARFNSNVKIAAFEASTVSYGRLVRDVILNNLESRICAGHYAAWHETALLEFEHFTGIYSMSPGNSSIATVQSPDFVEKVLAIPLDQLLADVDRLPGVFGSRSLGLKKFSGIAAIKIDVEGAEENVLRGAIRVLTSHRPNIICELLTEDAASSVREFMADLGYSVEVVPTERRNYLLIPEERREQLTKSFEDWKKVQKLELSLTSKRKLMVGIS